MQSIRLELGCLFMVSYLTFQFFQTKHPPITGNRICRAMVMTGTATLVLETAAIWSIGYMHTLPQWLVRLFSQLCSVSTCAMMMLSACYILSCITKTNLLGKKAQLQLLAPLICTAALALLLPSYYNTGSTAPFAYGPASYVAPLAALYYMGICCYYIFVNVDSMPHSRFGIFIGAAGVVTLMSIVQLVAPQMMLLGAGSVLLAQCAVFTHENSEDFFSGEGRYFTLAAFDAVVKDWIFREKSFTAVFVLYRELSAMEDKFGKDCVNDIIGQLNDYLMTTFKLDMFLPLEGCAAVLVSDPSRVKTIEYALQQRFDKGWNVMDVPIYVFANICSFNLPEPYSDANELINAAMSECATAQKPVVLIDTKVGVKNRKAFEQALGALHHNRKQYTSIHYLIADVVGMGKVNETHGFIAGDQLLKDCAEVLSEAAGEDVDVYRIGGDEFAILLVSKNDNEMRDLLDKIQIAREARNKERGQIPLDISIGYSRYYEDSDKTFNSMMARAEFQMNNLKKHQERPAPLPDDDRYNTTRLGTKLLK